MKKYLLTIAVFLLGTTPIVYAQQAQPLEDQQITITANDAYTVRPSGEVWVTTEAGNVPITVGFMDYASYSNAIAAQDLVIDLGEITSFTVRPSLALQQVTGSLTSAYRSARTSVCGHTMLRADYVTATGDHVGLMFQENIGLPYRLMAVADSETCDLYAGTDFHCGPSTCEIRSYTPAGVPYIKGTGYCDERWDTSGEWWFDALAPCDCIVTVTNPVPGRRIQPGQPVRDFPVPNENLIPN